MTDQEESRSAKQADLKESESGKKSDPEKVSFVKLTDDFSGEHDTLVCHQPDSKESVRGLGVCPNKQQMWQVGQQWHCLRI